MHRLGQQYVGWKCIAMEIQGEEEQIYRVIRSLTQGRWIRIEKMDVKNIPLVEKEHGFKAG